MRPPKFENPHKMIDPLLCTWRTRVDSETGWVNGAEMAHTIEALREQDCTWKVC